MKQHDGNNSFEVDSSIPDDLIAEALRSVEKHSRHDRQASQENGADAPAGEVDPDAFWLSEDAGDTVVIAAAEFLEARNAVQAEMPASPPPPAQESAEREAERRRIEWLKNRLMELTRANHRVETALEEKTAEAQRNYDRLLWAGAEVENVKKRANRERSEIERFGNERFLKEVLPVIDNLERALHHSNESPEIGILRDGVQMTLTQFSNVLRRFGVTRIDLSPGEPFDPTVHEAMMQEESAALPPNSVAREILSGYMLQDRLLRATLVTVSRLPTSGSVVEILEEDPTAGGTSGSSTDGALEATHDPAFSATDGVDGTPLLASPPLDLETGPGESRKDLPPAIATEGDTL